MTTSKTGSKSGPAAKPGQENPAARRQQKGATRAQSQPTRARAGTGRAAKRPCVLVINGPSLNRIGQREPGIYGNTSYADLVVDLQVLANELGVQVACFQSNHEGALIDHLQQVEADALIINGGGLSHTSVALRDAVADFGRPAIEVHISNTAARESFRRESLLAPVCTGSIVGLGTNGYALALWALADKLLQEDL